MPNERIRQGYVNAVTTLQSDGAESPWFSRVPARLVPRT